MYKAVNLLEIYNIFGEEELISDEKIKKFLQILNLKKHEIQSIYFLCQELKLIDNECLDIFKNYYINYKIPQIGKEFDLIRIDKNKIINIELKIEETTMDKISEQLKCNYHYLSP